MQEIDDKQVVSCQFTKEGYERECDREKYSVKAM